MIIQNICNFLPHAALDGVGRGGGGGARKGGKGPDTIVKRPTPGKPKP